MPCLLAWAGLPWGMELDDRPVLCAQQSQDGGRLPAALWQPKQPLATGKTLQKSPLASWKREVIKLLMGGQAGTPALPAQDPPGSQPRVGGGLLD